MKRILSLFAGISLLLALCMPSWAQTSGGINVRSSAGKIVFRRAEDDSSGNIVTTGTTTLYLYEVQDDGSLKSYDFADNTFKATALTTETASMTNRSGNNSTTSTGIWTYSLGTITGFTKGKTYIAVSLNALASPARDRVEFQFGGADGDVLTDSANGVQIAFSQTLPTNPTTNTTGQALFYAANQVGRTGTAQGGTASTITLDAGASAVDNAYASHEIKITGATGAGQFATIVSYVGSTKVATIARPGVGTWTTTPDATSVFMILPVPYSTVQNNLDKTGYALATAPPTLAQIQGGFPSTYPLSANDESTLGYLFNMIAPNGGTPRYNASALALAPSGTAADPWAVPLSSENTANTFGAFLKAQLLNPVPLPADFLTALYASSRWQRVEANEVGNYSRNPATGVITLTRQDGTTFTVTTTADSNGKITGRAVSP